VTNTGIIVIRDEEASKEKVYNNKENKEISSDEEYKNDSGKGNKVDKL
jgi:hypothetical protein